MTVEVGRHFEQAQQGPSRRWMTVFSVALVGLLAAAGSLTYVGVKTVRESRAGRNVATVTDPSLPGFEAILEPTPTLLVLHRSATGLVSVAVLALSSGDAGGSVLLVPPAARLTDEADAFTLAAVAAFGGSPEAIVPGLQDLIGIGIAEVAVVDDARWSELLAPVGPLAIDNPDAVGDFPAGSISLTPEQVGPYLGVRGDGESDLARLFRQQLVFEAWIDEVAASSDPGVVPGEVESGIGRFVRGLAAGERRFATLPVDETPLPEGTHVDVDGEVVATLMPTLVPFPTAPHPGGRTRVRLLDGTGDASHVLSAAPLIVPAGSEVVVVGNADRFDYGATEIRYHDPVLKGAAERLRDALGAGRIVDDARQTDAFDVTIVLGPDV
jgi:hypothetical protein